MPGGVINKTLTFLAVLKKKKSKLKTGHLCSAFSWDVAGDMLCHTQVDNFSSAPCTLEWHNVVMEAVNLLMYTEIELDMCASSGLYDIFSRSVPRFANWRIS